MTLVTPADSPSEANLLAISSGDELYMVTTQEVAPHTQLKYFSKEDPTVEFWTSWTKQWGGKQRKCSRCSVGGGGTATSGGELEPGTAAPGQGAGKMMVVSHSHPEYVHSPLQNTSNTVVILRKIYF